MKSAHLSLNILALFASSFSLTNSYRCNGNMSCTENTVTKTKASSALLVQVPSASSSKRHRLLSDCNRCRLWACEPITLAHADIYLLGATAHTAQITELTA